MRAAVSATALFDPAEIFAAVQQVRENLHVVRRESGSVSEIGVALGDLPQGVEWVGTLPPLYPEWLGDRSFAEAHGTRFAYCTGAMANGIATVEVVEAAARHGCLGFFGAAGLLPGRVAQAVDRLNAEIGGLPFGVNLIHSPQEPRVEAEVAELLVQKGVMAVEASAFMRITPPVVRYALAGVHRDEQGTLHRPRRVVAKVSRPEVARQFLSPAPESMLRELAQQGLLSPAEADLGRRLPVAEDVTVEADSGGHTDNRPLVAMFPAIADLARQIAREQGYARPLRVGAAGGLGTPASVAAAYALGAAYVMTGSVNQGCVESGVAPAARALLAKADVADVAMAPAADMFEMGVNVQVLRRGTMFAARAQKLRDLYLAHPSLDDIPPSDRAKLEKEVFQAPLADIWAQTERYFTERDPAQVDRARRDGKHQMALVFRWYLGKASRWAIDGDPARLMDYQLWCGPAMGAFNTWTRGSFLDDPAQRSVGQVALNLLEGAAAITRAGQLRSFGVAVPAEAFGFVPRPLAV
ncbi:MAG: PfaD family polyunsaturated fatty acid/polyketide biosynthesis protein [Deltaproteobacteria bacterium]|nr:PfaD family polyunsaturated fatty acid/polyketide biosynthesis protein [Deltaproteobacteria bacterium]